MSDYFEQTSLSQHEAMAYSPLALAFLGDCVYEQCVRLRMLREANMPVNELNRKKVSYVCADFQSAAVDIILPLLTEDELSVYKRGRNAKSGTVPKNATVSHYRRATGLEALFGYLGLMSRQERINELFAVIYRGVPEGEENEAN